MSQMDAKRGLQDNTVTGQKVRLESTEALRSKSTTGASDVNLIRVGAGDVPELGALPCVAAGASLTPKKANDLVTLEYVQNIVNGKGDPKDSVNLLVDYDMPLTGSLSNGLVIDGQFIGESTIITHPGFSVVLTAQTDATQNFVYLLTVDSNHDYVLTRRPDCDGSNLTSGAYCKVISGTLYAGYEVLLTAEDTISVGNTPLNVVKIATAESVEAGLGLTKSGSMLSFDAKNNSGLEMSPEVGGVRVKTSGESTKIDPVSGVLISVMPQKTTLQLQAADIANGYFDLPKKAVSGTVNLEVLGFSTQIEAIDYEINYTGGSNGTTRITLIGGLAEGGASALRSGDTVVVTYGAF